MDNKTKWSPSFNHGGLHPDGHGVYFSVASVGRISSLSGYVEVEVFRDLCQRFGVTDQVQLPAKPEASSIEPDEEEDREPAEPDGECFRGGEAAAYLAESQARIQRELK